MKPSNLRMTGRSMEELSFAMLRLAMSKFGPRVRTQSVDVLLMPQQSNSGRPQRHQLQYQSRAEDRSLWEDWEVSNPLMPVETQLILASVQRKELPRRNSASASRD